MFAKITECMPQKNNHPNFWKSNFLLFGRKKMAGFIERTLIPTLSENSYFILRVKKYSNYTS